MCKVLIPFLFCKSIYFLMNLQNKKGINKLQNKQNPIQHRYTKNRDLRSVGLKLNKGLNSNNRCGEHSKWVSRYRHPAGRWFVCALRLRSFAFCPPFDSRAAQPPPLFATRISLTWELLTSSCFTRGVIQLHRRRGSHVMVSRVRDLPTSASFVLSPQG